MCQWVSTKLKMIYVCKDLLIPHFRLPRFVIAAAWYSSVSITASEGEKGELLPP